MREREQREGAGEEAQAALVARERAVLGFFFFSSREHYKEWETLETGTKYDVRSRETKIPRV